MAGASFRHQHRVIYGECTLGNHVYYARYLDFLEAARGDYFRHLGVSLLELQQQELIFPVIECQLRFKSPARYDDVLAIEVWPSKVERVRLNFGYRITETAGKLILEADTFHVCTGLNERPKRLPESLAQRLAQAVPLPNAGSA